MADGSGGGRSPFPMILGALFVMLVAGLLFAPDRVSGAVGRGLTSFLTMLFGVANGGDGSIGVVLGLGLFLFILYKVITRY